MNAGRAITPAQAWAALRDGNDRFARDEMAHPSQGIGRRGELRDAQHPFAVVFGCSDSRVAAEIVFDQGLGDIFVVRTAGHVLDASVLGSIEYGVEIAGASLVVVLGHNSCGAVLAAARALEHGELPPGLVRAVVDRVIPSIVGLTSTDRAASVADPALLGTEHVRHTVRMLAAYSRALSDAVQEGRCAIVGLEYDLAGTARVRVVEVAGDIGETAA